MNTTKILSRDHSATRFEIYQADHNLWLRCHVCGRWLTDTEVKSGWIEIRGCSCTERRFKIDDMLRDAGITALKYDSTGEYRDEYTQFIESITAAEISLDDLLNGRNIQDMPILYQWIAFWTGNDVMELQLNFGTTR